MIPIYENFVKKLAESPLTRNIIPQIKMLEQRFGQEHTDLAVRILQVADKLGWDANEVFGEYMYDYLTELSRFLKTGSYGHDNFSEVYEKILKNKEIMEGMYYPGLFLAYGFTAVVFHKYHFYKNAFLPKLKPEYQGIEVGFGEGFFLWVMCNTIPGIHPRGYDISPSAREIAAKILRNSGHEASDLFIGNVLDGLPLANESQDFGIAAEVIEHLEHPEQCLSEMARVLRRRGLFFLATSIDENHLDHITNFPTVDFIKDLIRQSKFSILEEMVYRISDDYPDGNDKAVGIAFVCEKI